MSAEGAEWVSSPTEGETPGSPPVEGTKPDGVALNEIRWFVQVVNTVRVVVRDTSLECSTPVRIASEASAARAKATKASFMLRCMTVVG